MKISLAIWLICLPALAAPSAADPLTPGTVSAVPLSPTAFAITVTPCTGGFLPVAYKLYRGMAPRFIPDTLLYESGNPIPLHLADTGLIPSTKYCYLVRYTDGRQEQVSAPLLLVQTANP